MSVSPRALVERFYAEVWNRRDDAAARSILHPDFRFHASLGPERIGPAGFLEYRRAVCEALDEFTCVIEELVEADQRAAARMRFFGVHQGALFGVAATGRRLEWSGGAFFATDGARITRLWVLGDIDAVKRQLGAATGAGFEAD